MPQIYPNFSKSDANAIGAAPIQTGRVTVSNPSVSVPVVFAFPFADSNYTLQLEVEQLSGYVLPSFQISVRSATGFTLLFASSENLSSGPITIHFVAIHD